jgi:DNA polymerase-3 subunit gamma/tau
VSKALYRKYRSKTLGEIVGQKHITDILARTVAEGRISHAYLLTGPRGVGKTSVARILAHEINKLPYDEDSTKLDIIEIDAASNNGVEDVRDLREKVQIAPVSATKKVYIIDEVHMLSKAAFNALLKTLEEPPEHVVFILATTNAEKLPATIISRTQRFSFRPININDAVKHLRYIASEEKINVTDDALKLIAERSDGSFRDSISLLDQLSGLIDTGSNSSITVDLIGDALGLASNDTISQIITAVETRDVKLTIESLNLMLDNGISGTVIADQLINNLRNDIIDRPQLLPLMDALIDVARSPQPDLKLLTVIGIAAQPKTTVTKTAALLAPVREISATIAELKNKPKANTESVSKAEPLPAQKKIRKPVMVPNAEFDWDKLVEYTRQNYVALFSVLSKCGYELEGNTLTLYTNNKFYKTKLDDTKYSPLLSMCLQENGVNGLDIITIPTLKPSKDSKIAAIADIMGGGEEVLLEA